MGERLARYAIIIDHGKIVYAEKEPGREVTVRTWLNQTALKVPYTITRLNESLTMNTKNQVSSAESVLAKL